MSVAREPLIRLDRRGLHCPAGGFWIDPWRPVPRALITHAHADHARAGSEHYLAVDEGAGLLRRRLGAEVPLDTVRHGETLELGETRVSFHPAGHVLGSAQIRVEGEAGVWVVTGDFKRAADPTCRPFEPVPCDTLITEATFALPVHRWPEGAAVAREIVGWWDAGIAEGRCSVLFCYALGKAQRILAELHRQVPERTVWLHGAMVPLVDDYRAAGVEFGSTRAVTDAAGPEELRGALVLAPPSAGGTPWMRRLGRCRTAFASGWMRVRGNRRRRGVERGFVLSDHADWPGLLSCVHDSGAHRVLATHGQSDTLCRYLREVDGIEAEALATAYEGEAG